MRDRKEHNSEWLSCLSPVRCEKSGPKVWPMLEGKDADSSVHTLARPPRAWSPRWQHTPYNELPR